MWFGVLNVIIWGYNGLLLGFVLQLMQGKIVMVDIINQLVEEIMLYWYGLEVLGEVDGGLQGVIVLGVICMVSFMLMQWVVICWFYLYQYGSIGWQVVMGLVGLVLIEDEESGCLLLFKQWGIDDVLVIVQDKKFIVVGEIDYQLDVMSVVVGWFGDMLLINGVFYFEYVVLCGWLCLCLLNGCNVCFFNFVISDKCLLYVVVSDGGLLVELVKVDELLVLMGECFEVLVDISDGKFFDLVILLVSQMGMVIVFFDKLQLVLCVQLLVIFVFGKLLDILVVFLVLLFLMGLMQCQFQLFMDLMFDWMGMQVLMEKYGDQVMVGMDYGMMGYGDMSDMGNMYYGDMSMNYGFGMEYGMLLGKGFDFYNVNCINGKVFDMNELMFVVVRGQYECWVILGKGDMMLYLFYIYGIQFCIFSENGKLLVVYCCGWKDIVCVEGDVSEVLVKFDYLVLKEFVYMVYCYLLEYEDIGMMLGFMV